MRTANPERFWTSVILIGLVGLSAAGGCRSVDSPGSSPPPGELAQSKKERITTPDVPAGDLAELAAGNSAFAFDLYQEVRSEEGNVFFSPYSISIALAMTYAGARGETEQQMAEALNFTLQQDRLHPAFNALDLELAGRSEGPADADGEGFKLNIVNRLWGAIDYSFLEEFLDVLAENYGAGLSLLDFVNATEQSRIMINDWISDQTEDRIQDLLAPGHITPITVLVLTNAIYFKAAWAEPFDEAFTHDRPFSLLGGGQATVPMMSQVAGFGYAAGDGYQVIELPYEGQELSMVIILPDLGSFQLFEDTLDAARAESIMQDIEFRDINLTMPSFTFEWPTSLKDVLSALGMPIAFSAGADFSGMNGLGDLCIEDVIHKAFVAVDEEGTEAAAATAVIMIETSAPGSDALVVTIDRPFIFLIRDIETDTILFLGRVVDPSDS